MATAGEVLKAVESLDERNTKGHDAILVQLKEMNGTQRDHGNRLTHIEVVQDHSVGRIDRGEEDRGVLFKKIRELDKSVAVRWAYAAGAAAAVMFVLQYVVMPVFKHIFAGG